MNKLMVLMMLSFASNSLSRTSNISEKERDVLLRGLAVSFVGWIFNSKPTDSQNENKVGVLDLSNSDNESRSHSDSRSDTKPSSKSEAESPSEKPEDSPPKDETASNDLPPNDERKDESTPTEEESGDTESSEEESPPEDDGWESDGRDWRPADPDGYKNIGANAILVYNRGNGWTDPPQDWTQAPKEGELLPFPFDPDGGFTDPTKGEETYRPPVPAGEVGPRPVDGAVDPDKSGENTPKAPYKPGRGNGLGPRPGGAVDPTIALQPINLSNLAPCGPRECSANPFAKPTRVPGFGNSGPKLGGVVLPGGHVVFPTIGPTGGGLGGGFGGSVGGLGGK